MIEHHTISANGIRLHYARCGSGPPLILLHGWPQTWFEFDAVVPKLSEHFDVIAPDMRGMGDSDKPASGFDAETLAEDIAGFCAELDLGEVTVVGHDLGGPVAYVLAAKHRSLVSQLGLFEAPLPGIDVEGATEFMSQFWHMGFHQALDMPEALIGGRERMYLTWFFRKFAYNKLAVSPQAIDEFVRCYSAPGGLRASLAHYRAMPQSAGQIAKLAADPLDIPCVVFGGEVCLRDWPLKLLRQAAKNVQGGIIERCGHWVAEERPDWFVETLVEHFAH